MNPHDLNNLNFLLTSTSQELEKWYYAVDELDHDYASSLMAAYSHELSLRSMSLEPTEDLTLANLVLDKFRL